MHDAELVGGVLYGAADPWQAARDLADLLADPRADRQRSRLAGFEPDLVEVIRAQLGNDPGRIETACQLGAAWVMGRRSLAVAEPWDLVASLPGATPLPVGLRRTTGETFVQLVTEATATLRLAAPFIDRPGISYLADALAAATSRGVRLEILLPTRSTHAGGALDELRSHIAADGDPSRLLVAALRDDAPWAHLKALTADARAAYIGSANVTGAGLAGPNLELGILVRGPTVAVVERLLDLFRER
ncbi:MAG: phospholipase D family protein [Actinomycetota bacterium]|nr:phospholipase D family protein [Actinomycetota bacterium]